MNRKHIKITCQEIKQEIEFLNDAYTKTNVEKKKLWMKSIVSLKINKADTFNNGCKQ